jgi:hypothetical protein
MAPDTSLFVKERFGSVKKAMPGASHGAVMQQLSELWRTAKGTPGSVPAPGPAPAQEEGAWGEGEEGEEDVVVLDDGGEEEDLCCGVGRLNFV